MRQREHPEKQNKIMSTARKITSLYIASENLTNKKTYICLKTQKKMTRISSHERSKQSLCHFLFAFTCQQSFNKVCVAYKYRKERRETQTNGM